MLDPVTHLLAQAEETLTPEEERKLFAEYRRERRREIRDRIVAANLPLVVSRARQHRVLNENLEEKISVGLHCLIRAIEGFDPDTGFKFSTYYSRALHNALTRFGMRELRHRCRPIPDAIADRRLEAARIDARDAIERNLGNLTELEEFIVRHSFGLGAEELSYAELGPVVGLSQRRVRDICAQALDKLRALMEEA